MSPGAVDAAECSGRSMSLRLQGNLCAGREVTFLFMLQNPTV